MLKEVNRLYLGTTVLILLDLSYVSRFWTQFESWMSMQYATPDGLKPAVGTKNERHHIVCIQNAASQATLYTTALVDNWADQTPQQAHAFLSKPDVTVTNQSDKEAQLPKIKALDATVQGAFGELAQQLEDELTASKAAAAHADAELTPWETLNERRRARGTEVLSLGRVWRLRFFRPSGSAPARGLRLAPTRHIADLHTGILRNFSLLCTTVKFFSGSAALTNFIPKRAVFWPGAMT